LLPVGVEVADPNAMLTRTKTVLMYVAMLVLALPVAGCYFLLKYFSSSFRHYMLDKQTIWTPKSKAVIYSTALAVLYSASPQVRLLLLSIVATVGLFRMHKSRGTVPKQLLQVNRSPPRPSRRGRVA
jgi:hypothetical protein